jgi:hypothetical protein
MVAKVRPGSPRGGELVAAFAVLLILLQLVLAQLSLGFAVLFVMIGRASRWYRSWLLAPVAVGLFWALTAGPGHVFASFVAGPEQVLSYFGHGHVVGRLSHPLAGFAQAGRALPGQLPLALIAGAAEAAAISWLDRSRGGVGQPALPPRPEAVAALRGALARWKIRSGAVLTRNGCALGVVLATGAVAELRWAEITGGAVVTGPVAVEVSVTCLQVVHAALRRRKPLIVLDPGDDEAIAGAVAAACAATATRLRDCRGIPVGAGPEAAVPAAAGSSDTGSPDTGTDLVSVIGERSAVLLSVGSPQLADRACADVAGLTAELRRMGLDGDGLIWVPAGESLTGQALAALIRDGGAAGLPVLIGVTSPPAVTELAGSAATVLTLAPRTPSRKAWQFSLVVQAPRRRQLELAHVVPARLPSLAPAPLPPARPPRVMAASPHDEIPIGMPQVANRSAGRP